MLYMIGICAVIALCVAALFWSERGWRERHKHYLSELEESQRHYPSDQTAAEIKRVRAKLSPSKHDGDDAMHRGLYVDIGEGWKTRRPTDQSPLG